MLKPCWFLGCLVLAPGLLFGETLTQGERNRAMSELHATRKSFLDSVSGLSQAQWTFKPGPDRWSAAECAEHIAASEDFLFDLVTKKIMQSPAAPEKRGETKGRDEQLLKSLLDRSARFKAPEPLAPSGRYPGRTELLEAFKKSRDRTIRYVETTPDDLRAHFAPHPVFQSLDAYQWILLIAGHTQRHVEQILEVKADPRFPRN
jgi:uncharacterized damage-inducible protein DinB